MLQLYQLQTLDSEIDKIDRELAEIAAKLGESDALKQAGATAETAQENLHKSHAVMQDLDLEVKSLANKIENQEKKLYSGTVLNAKEAANLQDEVASLKRWYAEREESLLEVMMAVEEAEETLTQVRSELSDLKTIWADEQKQLQETQQSLETKQSELDERRPTIAHGIDHNVLDIYERLRPQKAGRAVAVVKNKVCQGCGMTPSNSKLQQARAGTELTYCGVCGRILYVF
jgi:predicted  nucleic acid-binding Zn-ribbon protein